MLETRMLFKGVPFIVTLEETHGRSPEVKLGIKVRRPYRLTKTNGSLAIDLYLLLTAHAIKYVNASGWDTFEDAKRDIAKVVYEEKPKGICWNASWYDVAASVGK